MTTTELAAALLRDVPRYDTDPHDYTSLIKTDDGDWLSRDEVLAALTAALDGVTDERAVEALAKLQSQIGDDVQDVYLPEALHKLSADTITALLAQIAALRAEIKGLETIAQEAKAGWRDAETFATEQKTDALKWFDLAHQNKIRADAAEAEVEKLRGAALKEAAAKATEYMDMHNGKDMNSYRAALGVRDAILALIGEADNG